jgi:hypothetical protein
MFFEALISLMVPEAALLEAAPPKAKNRKDKAKSAGKKEGRRAEKKDVFQRIWKEQKK